MIRLVVCALALVALTGCDRLGKPSKAQLEDAREAVIETSDKLYKTIDGATPADAAKFYESDGEVIAPSEIIRGRKSVREYYAAFTPNSATTKVKRKEVTISDAADLAVERGTYTVTPQGGAPIESEYVLVWKKDKNGDWKLLHDISVQPWQGAPPATTPTTEYPAPAETEAAPAATPYDYPPAATTAPTATPY